MGACVAVADAITIGGVSEATITSGGGVSEAMTTSGDGVAVTTITIGPEPTDVVSVFSSATCVDAFCVTTCAKAVPVASAFLLIDVAPSKASMPINKSTMPPSAKKEPAISGAREDVTAVTRVKCQHTSYKGSPCGNGWFYRIGREK